VIGQLKSKHAPQIQNHYYGNQKHDDEDWEIENQVRQDHYPHCQSSIGQCRF
jgi:hypothetical protein